MYWCCTNYLSSTCTCLGGAVALQIVCLMRDLAIQFSALAGASVLCSQMRLKVTYFILNCTCILNNPELHVEKSQN